MGANSTQAIAIVCFLIGFVLMAGAFAGGGIIYTAGSYTHWAPSCCSAFPLSFF